MSCAVGDLVELKSGPRWLPDSSAPLRLGIIIKVVAANYSEPPYDILYYVSWFLPIHRLMKTLRGLPLTLFRAPLPCGTPMKLRK